MPAFKAAVDDFHGLLSGLRLRLEPVETALHAAPPDARAEMEHAVMASLEATLLPEVGAWMGRFEATGRGIAGEARPAHHAYARESLHPLLLCAPFVRRAFLKPLGHAGDHEMVDMILRDPREGASLFAKFINVMFLENPAAVAHRNRIVHLKRRIAGEAARVGAAGRRVRILDVGCGPARELQEWLAEDTASDRADATLVDFDADALATTRRRLARVLAGHGRGASLRFDERSVVGLLKGGEAFGGGHDIAYCAGLFDYLSDRVCRRLMGLLYERLAPGGLLVATNVDDSRPFRESMDFLLDWRLNYRSPSAMRGLIPGNAATAEAAVLADPTGVNVYLELRKPAGGA